MPAAPPGRAFGSTRTHRDHNLPAERLVCSFKPQGGRHSGRNVSNQSRIVTNTLSCTIHPAALDDVAAPTQQKGQELRLSILIFVHEGTP